MRVADGQCPFCGTAFATALAPRPGVAARTRLSRAALFTFAASVGSAGCSSAVTNTDASPADTAAVVDQPAVVDRPAVTDSGPADTGTVVADSGPPPTDAGPPDDDGGTFAEYGGPPLTDAGPPDDEGNSSADYGSPPERDGGGIFPLYGAPARPDDAGV